MTAQAEQSPEVGPGPTPGPAGTEGGPPILPSGPNAALGVGLVQRTGPCAHAGEMVLGPALRGPDGRPALGALGVLVDEVLGYPIIESLGPDAWSVSTEIWVDLLAPLVEGARVHGAGHVVQPEAFSQGVLTDAAGGLVAALRQRARRVGELPAATDPAVVAQSSWPGDDLMGLLDMRQDAEDVWSLEVGEQHANPLGRLHGGISLAAS